MAMELENIKAVATAKSAAVQKATAAQTNKPADPKSAKLLKACQDFESVFISYLFKTMHSQEAEEDGDGFWSKGLGGSMFQDLYETEISKTVSGGPGMGLGAMLYRSLEPYLKSETPGAASSIQPAIEKIKAFNDHITEAVEESKLNPALLYAVITQESGGNPGEVSSKGAKGLMQLMDGTARELGVGNSLDPRQNILGGARYLRQMLDRFGGDLRLALAAYNAGPGAVERYGNVPPFTETQNYVTRVMEHYERYQTALKDGRQLA
jgi:Rod binding domain-containing protein